MRVAIFSLLKNHSWGGSENLWFKTALYLLKQKHKLLIIIYKNLSLTNQIAELKFNGAEIIVVNEILTTNIDKIINKISNKHYLKTLATPINKKIKSFNPSKILINQPGNYDLIFNDLAHKILIDSNKRFSLIFHSYIEEIQLDNNKLSRINYIIDKADDLFLVANIQKVFLEKHLQRKIDCIKFTHNPLSLKELDLITYPKYNDFFKMAMVTTIDFEAKGLDKLIRILSKEKWRKRNFEIEIYGHGKDRDAFLALLSGHSLNDKIKLMGFSSDIEEIWKVNQILIMSSNVDAAPSVLLEAMICGRSCICTNVGFNSEWIKTNETGFISKTIELSDFENAMEIAWKNRQTWEQLGVICHNQVKDYIVSKPEISFFNQVFGG